MMSILTKYRGWVNRRREKKRTKRLNKLEADLNMLSARKIKYNPKYYKQIDTISPEQEFSLNVIENMVWFIGKSRLIRQFYYTNGFYIGDLNYFWMRASAIYRKVHSGLPGLASNKMATILFAGGITNEITIYKTNEDGIKTDKVDIKASKIAKNNLEVLKDKSLFLPRINEGAVTESCFGHLFGKFNYDLTISNYPILEIADIRNADIIKNRGITTGIIFKNYYAVGPKQYVHKETYTTDDNGDAAIINEL